MHKAANSVWDITCLLEFSFASLINVNFLGVSLRMLPKEARKKFSSDLRE